MEKTVCELFAGVGGFRVGLESLGSGWKTTWFSQWEPGERAQWAHQCYVKHFGDIPDINGEYHTGEDIGTVDKKNIPDHTLLVGGFPCQDYSVAHTLASSKGIEGKKGVLWWQIRDIIEVKKPPFCIFENVDRILKSPAKQRGRDFGIILACLNHLGYCVEWRVVNAAVYGAAQRRRRTFIFAYRNDTLYAKKMVNCTNQEILLEKGLMAKAFPVKEIPELGDGCVLKKGEDKEFADYLVGLSDTFSYAFKAAGVMIDGIVCTTDIVELEEKPTLLGQILEHCDDEKCYISEDRLPKWAYQKGAKKILRKTAEGHEYWFSEGAVSFPDSADKPGRTMLTSESTLNRTSHVVEDPKDKRLRTLTPREAERLQGFPDDWTEGMPNRRRFFCMGNALVVPMIARMGKVLDEIVKDEKDCAGEKRARKKGKSRVKVEEPQTTPYLLDIELALCDSKDKL